MSLPLTHAQELYLKKLKAAGASSTLARSAVFTVLLKNGHQPMTMHELIDAIDNAADRASIYRSVKLLEEIGIAKRLHIGWKYKLELSDDFHDHHHHLTCTECGATHATHDDDDFEYLLQKLAAKHGYEITDHQLDIRGVCKNCRTKLVRQ